MYTTKIIKTKDSEILANMIVDGNTNVTYEVIKGEYSDEIIVFDFELIYMRDAFHALFGDLWVD